MLIICHHVIPEVIGHRSSLRKLCVAREGRPAQRICNLPARAEMEMKCTYCISNAAKIERIFWPFHVHSHHTCQDHDMTDVH